MTKNTIDCTVVQKNITEKGRITKEPTDRGHRMIVGHKARRQDAIKTSITKNIIIIEGLTKQQVTRRNMTIIGDLEKSLFTKD